MTRQRTGEPIPGLGARIRELRGAAGLTQEALAERAGSKVETISRIETAASVPDLDSLVRLARALGLPVHALFPGAQDDDVRDPQTSILLARFSGLAKDDRQMVIAIAERLSPK